MALSPNPYSLSRIMAWAAGIFAVGTIPVLVSNIFAVTIFGCPLFPIGLPPLPHLAIEQRLGVFAIYLVPAIFTTWAWWSLRGLFLLYASGEVYSDAALHQMKKIAAIFLAAAFAAFLADPFAILIETWSSPVAQNRSVVIGLGFLPRTGLLIALPAGSGRLISFIFGWVQAMAFFKAALVYVIARIMEDARHVADENAKFV